MRNESKTRARMRVDTILERVMADTDSYRGSVSRYLERLWKRYLSAQRGRLLAACALSLVVAMHPFAFTLTTRFLVDKVLRIEEGFPDELRPRQFKLAWIFIAINAAIWALHLAAVWTQTWLTRTTGQKLVFNLRRDLHAKLQDLHIGYFEKTWPGKIMARVIDDVGVIHKWVTANSIQLITQILAIVCGLSVMFFLNWKLALVIAMTLPLYAFAFMKSKTSIRRNNIALRRMNASLYGTAAERLGGVQMVKAFGKENNEVRLFTRTITDMIRVRMRLVVLQQRLALISGVFSALTLGGVAFVVMNSVKNGTMSLGSALAFYFALGPLLAPVGSVTSTMTAFEGVLVVLQRVFALLDEKQGVLPGKIEIPGNAGTFSFESVTFSYPLQSTPALTNISLCVQSGEQVAVMGPSGAGKSSLFHLLLRFYDPDQGTVKVGNIDLRNTDPRSVRRHIRMVQQEPTVFSGTIAENIKYGRHDATPSQIIKAAERAEIHDFILSLPQKYETEVGETGITLSGGQRQRLALATALLTEPEVLLLDDTTSALDAQTEVLIRETLKHVLKGRTSLVITQRVMTARNADRIVVLENGIITHMGTHHELIKKKGFYRTICEQQYIL